MNDVKALTDILASEIVSNQMKYSTSQLHEVVDSMNLPSLAFKICQFHEFDVKRADISAVCIGAVALAQMHLFPDMHYLDGVTESFAIH